MTATLSLVFCLLATSAAREFKPREEARKEKANDASDDGVDRYMQMRVKPTPTFVACGAVTAAATALQVATPSWVRGAIGAARCERGAGRLLLGLVEKVNELKTTDPLGLTMMHGFLLKAIAEVLAQVIPQAGAGSAWLDPLRTLRSTVASLLSSSLTFYYWTRLAFVRGLRAPSWLSAVLGKTFGTALTKMLVTQAMYRPINVGLFLLAQSFFRGDNARTMVGMMKSKFKGGVIGGIVFFAFSNMLMFSVPVPYLHPIMGAIAGLVFNVWLAMVAYQKDPAASEAAAPAAESAAASLAAAAAQYVPSAVTEMPATSAALAGVAALEGVAAAGLYGANRRAAGEGKRAHDDTTVPMTPTTANAI